jgi:hypothetical protein
VRRRIGFLGLSLAVGCAALPNAARTGALFSRRVEPVAYDFEDVSPGRLPVGFERISGLWAVASSPTARSGDQLLAIESERPAMLGVDAASRSDMRAEVAVRVQLGSSGAGIACNGGDGGYIVSVEPESKRVALYSGDGSSPTLLESHEAAVQKGVWTRVGIVCQKDLVTAYLDGRPVATHSASAAPDVLALYAADGVIAQFDDLRVAAAKSPGTK